MEHFTKLKIRLVKAETRRLEAEYKLMREKRKRDVSVDTFRVGGQMARSASQPAPSIEETIIKRETVGPDDFFCVTGLCNDPDCHQLQKVVRSLKPHSDVDMKRAQRGDVIDNISLLLQSQSKVNVYIFDDFLPTDNGATLFTADLIDRFGTDSIHIWAPNLKPEIVNTYPFCFAFDSNILGKGTVSLEHQRGLSSQSGVIIAGEGCWHNFNARWADEIQRAGGLDVVFADCFRGFEKGAGALVQDFMTRRLFRRSTSGSSTMLSFAVSDRSERARGQTVPEFTVALILTLQDMFHAPSDPAVPYSGAVSRHTFYGRTMHYVVARVKDRQWVDPVAGFVPQLTYVEV
jgi:hypothetical protein